MNVTYSECVFVALGTQREVRHIVTCRLPESTIFFPTLSHKRHDFRKINLLDKKFILIFSTHFL